MSARFLAGVGAWLLGAAAATAGSLLAVSALGQGLAPAPSQQLTVAAVNHALASEAAEAAGPAANAKVTFEGSRKLVTMVVSCHGGVPAASTTVGHDT